MHFGHKVWVSITVEAPAEKPAEEEKEKPKVEVPEPAVVEGQTQPVKEKKVDDDVPEGPLRQKLVEVCLASRALTLSFLVTCLPLLCSSMIWGSRM